MNFKTSLANARNRFTKSVLRIVKIDLTPKPKDFVNNPKVLKELAKQRRRKKSKKTDSSYIPGPDSANHPGISEQNIREGMSGTNWG